VLVRSSVVMRKLSGLRAFTRGQLDLRLVVVRWCDRSAGVGGRGWWWWELGFVGCEQIVKDLVGGYNMFVI